MIDFRAISAYREGAVRLRQAAQWNEYDTRFQDDGGVIVPIVDANVIKLFLDPEHSTDRITVFVANDPSREAGKRHGPRRTHQHPPELVTFAAITAEYLFLWKDIDFDLGGDRGRLWSEPCRLAPAHGEEVGAMLREVARKGLMNLDSAELPEGVSELVEHYRRALRELDGMSMKEKLKLVRSVPDALAALFSKSLLEGVRWLRLTRDQQVLPLSGLAYCDPEVLDPPTAKVERWYRPLLKAKMDGSRDRLAKIPDDTSRKREERRIENRSEHDAVVLAQTILLNENAREMKHHDGKRRRCVLISGDDALHRVYQDEFWANEAASGLSPDEIRNRYVLRRPLQFSPVLNLKDMPNGYNHAAAFRQMTALLDDFINFIIARTDGAYAIEHDWRKQQLEIQSRRESETKPDRAFVPAVDVGQTIDRLRTSWSELIDTSSAICAGLAVRDFRALVDRFSKIAADGSSRDALIRLYTEIFSQIDVFQLPLVVQELLTIAVRNRMRQAAMPGLAGVRMPFLITERFDDLTDGVPIGEFIERLTQSPSPKSQGRNLEKLMQGLVGKKLEHRALFFVGTAAAVANHFEAASRYLRRAIELQKTETHPKTGNASVERDEIEHLAIVVERMRMRDDHQFEATLRRAEKGVRSSRKNTFEHVRAVSETAALRLMYYFNVVFEIGDSGRASPPSLRRDLLRTARQELDLARGKLPPIIASGNIDKDLRDQLAIQVHTNILCCAVTESLFFEDRTAVPPKLLPSSTEADSHAFLSERLMDVARGDHIVELWLKLTTWLSHDPAERAKHSTDLREFCVARVAEMRSDREEYRAPVDLKTFEYVGERIAVPAG